MNYDNTVKITGHSKNKGIKYDLMIPDKIDTMSITGIVFNAFYGCLMTSFVLPEEITEIGLRAFSYFNQMISINIPKNVKIIEMGAFQGCNKLSSIIIPDNATT